MRRRGTVRQQADGLLQNARPDVAHGWGLIARLVDFALRGVLQLDRMVTRTYPLADINAAFAALSRGDNARGLLLPTN